MEQFFGGEANLERLVLEIGVNGVLEAETMGPGRSPGSFGTLNFKLHKVALFLPECK